MLLLGHPVLLARVESGVIKGSRQTKLDCIAYKSYYYLETII